MHTQRVGKGGRVGQMERRERKPFFVLALLHISPPIRLSTTHYLNLPDFTALPHPSSCQYAANQRSSCTTTSSTPLPPTAAAAAATFMLASSPARICRWCVAAAFSSLKRTWRSQSATPVRTNLQISAQTTLL
mmetsp:Transcript_16034/g.40514  ORF Transcript_16034/g.40514 Transcript_16034/m.40514 type:complete len:133 (+) Transcript_16034:39-437(+)